MHTTALDRRHAAGTDSSFRRGDDVAFRSILAVTDLSPGENVAVQRASQLARAHRADLRFVKADKFEDVLAQSRGMDLVVLGDRHDRSTAAFFRGQPVTRLLRECACPVLVVRGKPAPDYARVLVAVDFSPVSDALVQLASGLAPSANLEIFHAISTLNEARLRSAEATEQAVRSFREQCRDHADGRMRALTARLGAGCKPLLTTLTHGDPGREAVVRQLRTGAGLVVVGKRPASAWEDFFCGSVAHRILSWGDSDVLVVPCAPDRSAVRAFSLKVRQAAPAGFHRPAPLRSSHGTR